jgi:hypothetical protein
MVRQVTFVLLFVMEMCTLGCTQSTTLTRAKAKDIIENSSEFKTLAPGSYFLRFPDAGGDRCTATKELLLGTEEGYWFGDVVKYDTLYRHSVWFGELTDKGKKYFEDSPRCLQTGVDSDYQGAYQYYGESRWVISPTILHWHITRVTGITGDDRNKKVELEWVPDYMNELPGDLRQLFPVQEQPLRNSHVNLTLYDDGWRVVN